jgi:DNA-binding GntR family transcriptional regulator
MSSRAGVLSDTLRDAILRGELEPGSPLRQDQLASALGVSKIPVREALQRLAAEGLATFEANRGFSVASLTSGEAEEIYALRAAIEPPMLARAIPKLTIVDLAKAELALSEGNGATSEGNWRFHRALYAPAGWDRGLGLLRTLHASVAPYLLLYLDEPAAAATSEEQHRRLLEHCRSVDIASALAVLDEHLSMAGASLVRSLSGRRDARPPRGAPR